MFNCPICKKELSRNPDSDTITCTCGAKITRTVTKTTFSSSNGEIPPEFQNMISNMKNGSNESSQTNKYINTYSRENQSNNTEFFLNWPIIVLATLFFPPIGILMIFAKAKAHRKDVFTISKKTFYSAITMFVFSGLLYLPKIMLSGNSFSKEFSFYSGVLKFANYITILGIILLLLSFFQKRKAESFRNYLSIIVNQDIEDLDEIAKKMNLDKAKVINDIKFLMKKRFLPSEYDLDISGNRIYDVPTDKRKRELAEEEKKENTRIVKCPNCSANNKLTEKIGKCEYCNTYIE